MSKKKKTIRMNRKEYDDLRKEVGKEPLFEIKEDRFKQWNKPSLRHLELTKWNWCASYPEKLKLGLNVDIGAFTYIQAQYGVSIGNNVQIGSHCSIYSADTEDDIYGPIIIEDDVLIGAHTTILPNTIIKKGAKIPWYSKLKEGVYE